MIDMISFPFVPADVPMDCDRIGEGSSSAAFFSWKIVLLAVSMISTMRRSSLNFLIVCVGNQLIVSQSTIFLRQKREKLRITIGTKGRNIKVLVMDGLG